MQFCCKTPEMFCGLGSFTQPWGMRKRLELFMPGSAVSRKHLHNQRHTISCLLAYQANGHDPTDFAALQIPLQLTR